MIHLVQEFDDSLAEMESVMRDTQKVVVNKLGSRGHGICMEEARRVMKMQENAREAEQEAVRMQEQAMEAKEQADEQAHKIHKMQAGVWRKSQLTGIG